MAIIFATETSAGLPIAFTLVRGTRWEDDFQLVDQVSGNPVDLTGIVGLMIRVRKNPGSAILLELSVANTLLVVTNPVTGSVGIRVDSETTRDFPENGHRKAKYLYDAVIERSAGEYEPAISGKIVVLPQITRPWAVT
jgi:hypothetical protein